VPYDSRTELVGIVARHADGCPVRSEGTCRCGPLGYLARVWDWNAAAWVSSPVLRTAAEARNWQRAAHALEEDDRGANARDTPTRPAEEDGAEPAEQLFWWAFCYVGLGFVGVAVAFVAADIAG
jgi:hypothetical protein